jgi:hypothetical protein
MRMKDARLQYSYRHYFSRNDIDLCLRHEVTTVFSLKGHNCGIFFFITSRLQNSLYHAEVLIGIYYFNVMLFF